MAKHKSFNLAFDKMDQTFAQNDFKIQQATSEINEMKAKFEKLRKERTDKEVIEKVTGNRSTYNFSRF